MHIDKIKSPLNYVGGKYKLLEQLLKIFPEEFDSFIDIFCGGLNVGINIKSKIIIANDYNEKIIELYKYFQANEYCKIESEIYSLIKKYKLSDTSKNGYEYYECSSSNGVGKYNKEGYLKLRENYNIKPTPIKFFTLIIYCFNHQIRFNNKGLFNLPVGKRDFNSSIKNNLKKFCEKIKISNINFYSKDYKEIEIPINSFVYLDPPYLASTASYNENGGWNEKKEIELLEYIDDLHNKNIKFALSNVLQNKDKVNNILSKWIDKNKDKYVVHYLNKSYSNSNYQSKNRDIKTIEILVTNYGAINAK